jgi:hypothetical protein
MFNSLRVVAGIGCLAGEDGDFHHHPHVGTSEPLDLAKMFYSWPFIGLTYFKSICSALDFGLSCDRASEASDHCHVN